MPTFSFFNNYTTIHGDIYQSDHSRTTTNVDSYNTIESTHSSQPLPFPHDPTLMEPRTPSADSRPSDNIPHQATGAYRTQSTSPSNDVEHSYPPSPRFTHSNISSESLDNISTMRNATTAPVAKKLYQYILHKGTGWFHTLLGYVCMEGL
ncbi:hypothetical protein BYT27DRAFT_7196320 [Phlegmacium glaucopus]|nr:hypothetical protein BYT27DRAFT_7196320 [Phlegmacium glaucopus]